MRERWPSTGHWRLPRRRLLHLAQSVVTGHPRSLRADVEVMVAQLAVPPTISGLANLPAVGPACLVANHYQRRDLWIGWTGAAITWAVGLVRSEDPPARWLVIGEYRATLAGRAFTLPGTAWTFRRVAHGWGMVPLATDPNAVFARAQAIRHMARLLAAGNIVCLFPEGSSGHAGPPGPAQPGAETLLRRTADRGIPVIPVGVCEGDCTLQIAFGAPLGPADDVMAAISRLYTNLAEN